MFVFQVLAIQMVIIVHYSDPQYNLFFSLQSGNIVKINHGRLTLCEVTAQVLAKCFDILGLKYVEKM